MSIECHFPAAGCDHIKLRIGVRYRIKIILASVKHAFIAASVNLFTEEIIEPVQIAEAHLVFVEEAEVFPVKDDRQIEFGAVQQREDVVQFLHH